jgi:hypothetical protein
MRIEDRYIPDSATARGAQATAAGQAELQRGLRGRGLNGASGGDHVELSGISGQIHSALASGAADRVAHVSKLAELFRSGRYQIDTTKLSQAILGSAIGSEA